MKSELGFDGFINLPLPNAARLRSMFGAKKDMVIFDIGSCEGEDSIRYARFFPKSKVHAFEPIPSNLKLIHDNVKRYKLNDQVVVNDIALSNKNGTAKIHVSSGQPDDAEKDWNYGNKSSSLLKPEKALEVTPWLKFDKEITINTQRLDDYCKQAKVDSIDIIHMDVQGAELMVLEGGKSVLKNTAAIWLEVEAVELYKGQPLQTDIEDFMERNGFKKVVDTVDTVAGDQLYINPQAMDKIDAIRPLAKSLSVIIPTYNRADYIKQAIDSALSQDHFQLELEVLVVDDGSTDQTQEIISTYDKKLVKYIKTEHSGNPAVARNIGLHEAKGELVAFLDSDDVWTPGKLKKQIKLFDTEDTVLAYGQAATIDDKGKDGGGFVVKPEILRSGETLAGLLKDNSISTSTVIARKEALAKAGGFNEDTTYHGVEDYELWLRIALAFPDGIACLEDVLAQYRRHTGNISDAVAATALSRIKKAHESALVKAANDQDRQLIEAQITSDHASIRQAINAASGEKPDISVVMSVYNGESLLRPAIESVLNQTFANFEFIIINDGSTDSSKEIIESYDDPRIHLVNQENHGLVFSLNRGFSIASTELIARMDADDISLPSRFERQVQAIASDKTIAVVGSFFSYVDEENHHLGTTIVMPTKDIDLRRSLYTVNPFAHGSALIRKSAWEAVGGYTDSYGPTEDYVLWCQIANQPSVKFAMLPEVLYWYRISPNSISHKEGDKQHISTRKIAHEQWIKPFIGKRTKDILADGAFYRQVSSVFGGSIFETYYSQQLQIMQELFMRRHFLTGLKLAIASFRLKPGNSRKLLVRSVLGGLARKIGVKK